MANPYRDKRGRFTSAGRAVIWIGGGAAIGAGIMAGGAGAGTGALLGALSGTAGLAQAKLLNTAGDAAGRGIERLAYGSPKAKAMRGIAKAARKGALKPISKKESAQLRKKFKT